MSLQQLVRVAVRSLAICGTGLCLGNVAWSQWQLIKPPRPAQITDFGVADQDATVVQVATNSDGAWKSIPNGRLRWLFTDMGLIQVHITAVPIAPGDNSRRYLMSFGGGLHTSADGGVTWENRTMVAGCCPQPNRPWVALAVGPQTLGYPTLLAGGDGRLRRSTDNAAVWSDANNIPNDAIITDIEFVLDVGTDEFVWAASAECAMWEESRDCADLFMGNGHGVLYSTDNGISWTERLVEPSDATHPKNSVNAVATIPGQPASCFAATDDGLWFTNDYGATWMDFTPPTLSPTRITDVVYTCSPSSAIYLGSEVGVWRGLTTGGKLDWSQLTDFPSNHVTSIGSTAHTSQMLYVGYANGDIWRSRDADRMVASADPIVGAHGGYSLGSLAIKADDESTVYVATACQQGLFKRTVSANIPSWKVLTRSSGHHFHYGMRIIQDPLDTDTVYFTETNRFWRSFTAGESWDLPIFMGAHVHALAVAPNLSTRLYMGSGHGNLGGIHPPSYFVYQSDDRGASWTDISDNLNSILIPSSNCTTNIETGTSFIDMAVSEQNPDTVYVATFGSENYPGDTCRGRGQGVVRRVNGAAWELINTGLNPTPPDNLSLWVASIAMRVRGGQLITYIATLDGLFRLVGESGTSWTRISPNGVDRWESIAIDPVDNNVLYAGTSELPGNDALIYRSIDGGKNWAPMTIRMAPLAWAPQYRVRDIRVGRSRAYAVVEGGGIYTLRLLESSRQVR